MQRGLLLRRAERERRPAPTPGGTTKRIWRGGRRPSGCRGETSRRARRGSASRAGCTGRSTLARDLLRSGPRRRHGHDPNTFGPTPCNADFRKSQQLRHTCSQMARKQAKRLQTGLFRPPPHERSRILRGFMAFAMRGRRCARRSPASDVAAGDGALRTCSAPVGVARRRSRRPARRRGRPPGRGRRPGRRSTSLGRQLGHVARAGRARTRCGWRPCRSSLSPVRQQRRIIRQVPGQASVARRSRRGRVRRP